MLILYINIDQDVILKFHSKRNSELFLINKVIYNVGNAL